MKPSQDKIQEYDIAIVGAGPAGLTAAMEAHALNWRTIVIDKEEDLGGKTAHYTCKADEQCRQCGVCQVCDAITSVFSQPKTDVRVNTQVKRAEYQDDSYILTLQSGESNTTIRTSRILLATGFDLFSPELRPALGYGQYRNVTTLDHLEKHLRADSNLHPFLTADQRQRHDLSAAFIQCVGSRDARNDANYCSQVCCRVSLKIANLLMYKTLVAHATIFYTDLQTLDTNSRSISKNNNNLRLIRGLPAEVTRTSDNQLCLRYESSASNQVEEQTFDLIVLAGAIRPVSPLPNMDNLEEITPDHIGFWQVSPNGIHAKNLGVAGTASGPMDILSAMAHGRYAVRELADGEES